MKRFIELIKKAKQFTKYLSYVTEVLEWLSDCIKNFPELNDKEDGNSNS